MATTGMLACFSLILALGHSPAAQAQEVKIGIVQPLSGIPVIVDFGES
jgi:ABC-type sugar transport system substrate-binding protein